MIRAEALGEQAEIPAGPEGLFSSTQSGEHASFLQD